MKIINQQIISTKVCNYTKFTLNGKLHNINDLPAIIYDNGNKLWYQNGLLHRLNGPATIHHDKRHRCKKFGYKKFRYYLYGNKISIPTNIQLDNEKIKEYLLLQMNF